MEPDDKANTGGKKKFKRKLTPFLCQEMLYDYALDRLDTDRQAAVSEFLQNDQECRNILEGIRVGLTYAERLGRTTLTENVMQQLRESENAVSLGKKYSSWREWPEVVRWSLTAIVLSTVVAMIVGVIPWNKIPSLRSKKSDSIEIAQLGRPLDKAVEDAQDHQEGDNATEEGSGDEEIEAPDGSSLAMGKNPPPSLGDDEGDEEGVPNSGKKPLAARPPVATAPAPGTARSPIPVAGLAPAVPPASPAVAAKPPVVAPVPAAKPPLPTTDADADGSSKHEAKAKGFVYRAFMTLGNLDELGPKITENITELGGEKAGEVELGWKRGTGRYYHFALGEENEERLLEKLRAYGPVRISKDPHPRVMPTGQIRVILWVESAK